MENIINKSYNLCKSCAKKGNCCCILEPSQAHLSVPLSKPELDRLKPFANLANPEPLFPKHIRPIGNALITVPENTTEEYQNLLISILPQDKLAIKEKFPLGGVHYRLRTNVRGECVFLSNFGCVLPRNSRPWYCILYPLWIQSSTLTLFISENCEVTKNNKNPLEVAKTLGMSNDEIYEIYQNIRKDWGLTI